MHPEDYAQAYVYADRLDMFRERVAAHDLTYAYADDIAAWRRGVAERQDIIALARTLSTADVRHIWNANVDAKITASERRHFYWGA